MRNTGSPSGDHSVDQLATRERPAGLTGMTERLVVLTKPGSCEKTHPAKRRSTVVLIFIPGAVTRDSCLLNSREPLRVPALGKILAGVLSWITAGLLQVVQRFALLRQ